MSDAIVTKDKCVHFIYSITDADGHIVDQSDTPIGYIHGGRRELADKVEAAMEGLKEGEAVDVSFPEQSSLWPYDPSLVFTDSIENIPKQFQHVGAQIEMTNERGESRMFLVTAVEGGKLTADGNHPLAGKACTFHVVVKSIRDASAEEIERGRPDDSDFPADRLH